MGAPDSAKGHRILVVDDEADLAESYERLLRRDGHQVISTGSVSEAIDAIRSGPLALVIADLNLADSGDGLDVVRAAKTVASPPPVIVITGFVSERSRRAALAAGAVAYLPKPFEMSAFTSLIESVLMRS